MFSSFVYIYANSIFIFTKNIKRSNIDYFVNESLRCSKPRFCTLKSLKIIFWKYTNKKWQQWRNNAQESHNTIYLVHRKNSFQSHTTVPLYKKERTTLPHASILRRVFNDVLLKRCARPLITRTITSRRCRVCTIKSTSFSLSTTILRRCWSFLNRSTWESRIR